MKTNLVRVFGALLCAASFMLATQAYALKVIRGQHTEFMWQGMSGIMVTVTNKAGDVVLRAQSDANGQISLKDLPPGYYEADIDGTSLVDAMDKLTPPEQKKKKESSSFSLGVGGMFGGGSSHKPSSHEGAGPASNGHDSHTDTHSSGGGVGVGMDIPVGSSDKTDSSKGGGSAPTLEFDLSGTWSVSDGIAAPKTSFSFPYCRDTAKRGMSIGFKVPPEGGNVTVAISSREWTGELR